MRLNRTDVLGYYLLLVAASWVVFPSELFISGNLNTAGGISVLATTTALAILAGLGGILVYLYFRLRRDFNISLEQMSEADRLREIHVIVGPNDRRKTEARAYTFYISVRKWSESAEEIHFHIRQFNPYKPQEFSPLNQIKNIPASGNPILTLQWKLSKEEFESSIDGFATAVNDSPEIRLDELSLPAGGLPVPFTLCFSYPKSDVLYFPSVAVRTYPLGQKHPLELYMRVKGRPPRLLKRILIDATEGWSRVKLTELEGLSLWC